MEAYNQTEPVMHKQMTIVKCHDAILKNELKNEVLLFYFNLAFHVFHTASLWIFNNCTHLAIAVVLTLFLILMYKSYWSPVIYIKEIDQVGYDHIKGPNRSEKISRAQRSRKFGTKIPPPYPNGWFAVAESLELGIGDVISVEVLGQNLCVYRGEDGTARCVDAYCPHLGANLGVGGIVCGNCIECPFHQWRFDSDGTCVSVPGQDKPPKGVSVKTWPNTEVYGAVFIWHDAENREPFWTISVSPEISSWGFRGRNEYYVNSHIQEIPENGADVAHLNAVHSTSVLTDIGDKYPFLHKILGQHSWSAVWLRGDDHTAEMQLKHDYNIYKLSMFHFDTVAKQMGPGMVCLTINSAFGPICVVQTLTPIEPMVQKVVHRIFSPAYNAPYASLFVYGESYMFERDIKIWNSKRYVSSPSYVRTDKTIRAFRAWYSQFYSENSITFRDSITNSLDW